MLTLVVITETVYDFRLGKGLVNDAQTSDSGGIMLNDTYLSIQSI